MTLFKTTEKQRLSRHVVVDAMMRAGLSESLVENWFWLAEDDKGVFELGELWFEESDTQERGELISAIRGILREVGL